MRTVVLALAIIAGLGSSCALGSRRSESSAGGGPESVAAREARAAFQQHLSQQGESLDALTPERAVEAMTRFYRNVRTRDCNLDADGDMLLFQWGEHDWGQGSRFQVEIVRQLIPGDGEDPEIWQLRLILSYPTNLDVDPRSGNQWCPTPAKLDDFVTRVRSTAVYHVLKDETPEQIELVHETTD